MSTLNPPIPLEKSDNQARVDYIQDYASGILKLINILILLLYVFLIIRTDTPCNKLISINSIVKVYTHHMKES